MKTFMTYPLGCKVNSYECTAITQEMIKRGFVEDKNNPEIIIINTCSVTATGDQKSRQHIRKFKTMYPNSMIVVMGCYAQGNAEFIWNEIKPDILVGTTNRNKLVDYIEKGEKVYDVNEDFRNFEYEELGITSFSENVRAYLKIQDGCSNFCTYCIVPFRRGKARSRNPQFVLQEAENIVRKGYKEIVLTGIDVGSYGYDLENISFSGIVEEILNIEGLNSLRISSTEASQIDDKFIELFGSRKNFANHLHIPLQSGSASVLKRMNRKYDKEAFFKKIESLRRVNPDFALSTDVIVGFPGESEEEFMETYEFIKKCDFNMLHVFPYSPRKGTYAATLKDQVDTKVKKERVHKLLELSKEQWSKYVNRFIGKEVKVLIEKFDKENMQNIGHTSNYLKVSISSKEEKVGQYITVKLEKDMIISE